jgi:hypothetical protein
MYVYLKVTSTCGVGMKKLSSSMKYIQIYISIYVQTYIYRQIYVCTHVHLYKISVHVYGYVFIYMYRHPYLYVINIANMNILKSSIHLCLTEDISIRSVYLCTYTFIIHINVYLHICIYTYTCISTYRYGHIYIYAFVYIWFKTDSLSYLYVHTSIDI